MQLEHYCHAFERGRRDRYVYIQRRFADVFAASRSILDVGCDDNFLKSTHGDKVFGIDIGGTPDKRVDLEKESLRAFGDNSYDLIICTEVLEHIDNLHEVFDDIVRVSARHILISLPNCSSTGRMWRLLVTGRNKKFYGLPLERPADRHKWFFSYKEIIDFFYQHAQRKGLTVATVVLHYGIRYDGERSLFKKIKQIVLELLVRKFNWYNQSQDVFILLEKPHAQ